MIAMNVQELILNIAVNMGRLGRWCMEGRIKRLQQFLNETDEYVQQLNQAKKNHRFNKTFIAFQKNFQLLKTQEKYDDVWAEQAYTWANILTHRSTM